MKARIIGIVVFLIALLLVLLGSGTFYTVTQMQQAVVTQFGKVVRVVEKPGLHVKIPFVQRANFLEKRIMEWDGQPTQVPTLGKKFITVDTWARWRIIDPEKFYVSVYSEAGGHGVLDDRIESAVRDEISSLPLEETVRSSTSRAMEYVTEEVEGVQRGKQEIEFGRDVLVARIKESAERGLEDTYGIELIDVQIKRLNYIERVRKDVYERMRSERHRIAATYLSEARSSQNEILGKMNRELNEIESEGYKEARIVKGKADAEATRIYAQAYGAAPGFYDFLKTLETYRETIDENTTLVLTTDSAYFKYLQEGAVTPGPEKTASPGP